MVLIPFLIAITGPFQLIVLLPVSYFLLPWISHLLYLLEGPKSTEIALLDFVSQEFFFLLFLHFLNLFTDICKCVPLTISYHLYFLSICNVWSMLHHGSIERIQSNECFFMFTFAFLTVFSCFLSKKFLSLSFLFLKKYHISATE